MLTRRGRQPRIAIIGAGAGGIAAGAYLRRAGFTNFTLYERADGVGGVWRANRYPGAACDVMSHLYSFSFAPKHDWSTDFAPQPEILAYLEEVVDREGLRAHLRCGVTVTGLRWDEEAAGWWLDTSIGELTADVVVSAVGLFTEAKSPAIPGLSSFAGRVLHTADWPSGLAVEGQRIGVIGTGASAVQAVPALAAAGAAVTVFQRTPSWVMPKIDISRDPRIEKLPARWQPRARRLKTFVGMEKATVTVRDDPGIALREQISSAYLEHKIRDPQLRSALTPTIPFGCKRVLLAGDYLKALDSGAARLVTEPITEVAPGGVRTADGELHTVENLVLATGFEASSYLSGLEVIGRGGRRLHDEWGKDGVSAYLGMMVSGFPNLFLLYGPNTNQGGNSIIFVLECNARFVRSAVRRIARTRRPLDVRADVQARWVESLQSRLAGSVWTACGSYFRDAAGRITTQWPYSALRYAWLTHRVKASDFAAT